MYIVYDTLNIFEYHNQNNSLDPSNGLFGLHNQINTYSRFKIHVLCGRWGRGYLYKDIYTFFNTFWHKIIFWSYSSHHYTNINIHFVYLE